MNRKLALTIAVLLLVSIAGCLGAIGSDGESPGPIDQVPNDANMVVHLDTAVEADDATMTLADALADEDANIDDVEDTEAEFEEETGLDPDEARELLAFTIESDDDDSVEPDDGAFIVYADWDRDELIESISDEEDVDYDEAEHAGATVYEPGDSELGEFEDPPYVGELANGQYVIGDEAAVMASLDVEHDAAESLSGEMREAYDGVTDGYLTFAVDVSEDELPEDELPEEDELDTTSFDEVSVIAGSYYTAGDTVGVETRLHTDSENAAIDVADVTEGAISLYRGVMPSEHQDLKEELREIEVEQRGTVVSVTFQGDVDTLVEAIETAADEDEIV